jgi:hypothetical protein
VEIAPVGLGGSIVLTKDSLEHIDAKPTGLISAVVTDTVVRVRVIVPVVIVQMIVVVPVVIVVRMAYAVSVVVESSHG